jgi:serine protease
MARVRVGWRVAAAGLAAACAVATGTPAHARTPPESVHGLIVKLKPTSASGRESPQAARENLSRVFIGKPLALGSVRRTGKDAHALRWARDLSADEAQRLMESLRQDPRVAWVTPNVRERLLQATSGPIDPPDDPVYATRQWWLSASSGVAGSRGVPNIGTAWNQATGASPMVNVAVLDTGLLRGHPDLSGSRFDAGYDMVIDENGSSGDGDGRDADFADPGDAVNPGECTDTPNEDADSSWHGSRVAGIVGAVTDNGIGVAGINRGARIVSVRVAGKCGALVSDIIDGMRWAAGLEVEGAPPNPNPARIVNISFGSDNSCDDDYIEAIEELTAEGVLVIAAAGNQNTGVNRPANCPGVLAVGAVTRDGTKAPYSNFGDRVDIMTVGGELSNDPDDVDDAIFSTSNTGASGPDQHNYEGDAGTSFSAPIVSGVASLMLAVNPALTRQQLIEGIQTTARSHVRSGAGSLPTCPTNDAGQCYCTTAMCGAGLLDAPAALAYAADPPASGGGGGGGDDDDDGGGGGAMSFGWMLALALAVVLVGRAPAPGRSARPGRRR